MHQEYPVATLRIREGARSRASFSIERWLLVPAVFFAIITASCADLTAVQEFSKATPNQAQLDRLNDGFASAPAIENEWNTLRGTRDLALDSQANQINEEKVALDEVNALIVNYMKALGNLSDANLTDVSSQAQSVKDELTQLSKSETGMGLDAGKISAIGDLLKVATNDTLSFWRARKLEETLQSNQASFHALLDTETQIVGFYTLDFQNILQEIHGDVAYVDDHASSFPYGTRLLLDRAARKDTKSLNDELAAANSYKDALAKLGHSYDQLVQANGNFSAATYAAIKEDLDDVQKAYIDIAKL